MVASLGILLGLENTKTVARFIPDLGILLSKGVNRSGRDRLLSAIASHKPA